MIFAESIATNISVNNPTSLSRQACSICLCEFEPPTYLPHHLRRENLTKLSALNEYLMNGGDEDGKTSNRFGQFIYMLLRAKSFMVAVFVCLLRYTSTWTPCLISLYH